MIHIYLISIGEPLAEPIIKSQNSSRNLADGSDVTLSCALSFNSDITLTVCYGKFDQNFNEFTNESINDQFCILCPGSSTGDYGPLPRTPGWEVQRKEEGECGNDLENIIVIGNFSEEDEGIIFCFYGDSEDPYQLYTTHTLTYAPGSSKSYTLYIVIGVVASVIILLIAILIIAMFTKQWIKRQKSPGMYIVFYKLVTIVATVMPILLPPLQSVSVHQVLQSIMGIIDMIIFHARVPLMNVSSVCAIKNYPYARVCLDRVQK